MAKTYGKPASSPRRKNAQRSSHDNSNIFVILWEIIRLLCRKLVRRMRRFFKKKSKGVEQRSKGIEQRSRGIKQHSKKADFSFLSNQKYIITAVSAVAVIGIVAALIWGFTNKNAYEISIGEKAIGIIKVNKSVTVETLTTAVTSKISNDLSSRIKPTESISIKNIHASKKKMETEDALLSKLASSLGYQVEAVSVTLEGVEIALLKNESEYESLKERLIAPFRRSDTVSVSEGFIENLTTTKRYTDVSEITSTDKAYERLSAKYETQITYTVKSGDVMGAIASRNGTSAAAICELNGIQPEDMHKLKVGQELLLSAEKPVLSVQIVEEVKYTEPEDYQTVTQLNPNERSSYSKVLQKGKKGQAEVTAHVTMVNGSEHSREAVDRVIITPAVNEIIEVGSN